jgi:hypothetical protein
VKEKAADYFNPVYDYLEVELGLKK